MTSNTEALLLAFAMGAAIFFCRAFPFLFFRDTRALNNNDKKTRRRAAFLRFVEKTVPPAAMTVLAFNALAGPIKSDLREGIPALTAAGLTAVAHLWKRNPLISIFGGTAVYMILERVIMR